MITVIKKIPIKLDMICWIYFWLNFLDCVFTIILVRQMGAATELNFLYNTETIQYTIWYKMLAATVVMLLFSWHKRIMKILTVGVGLYVVWNFAWLTFFNFYILFNE